MDPAAGSTSPDLAAPPERACRAERAKRIAGRLLLGLLAVPLTFVLTYPSSESPDHAYRYNTRGLGKRVRNIARQAESVAAGHYLADASGGSYTRDAIEAIGYNLLLADLALVRKHLGLPHPTRNTLFRSQAYICATAVLLMVLAGAPLWSVALAVLLFGLFPASASSRQAQRTWPQIASLGTTVTLVGLTAKTAGRWSGLRWRAAGLFVLAMIAGFLGKFRHEAGVIAAAPFAALLGLNLLVTALRLRSETGGAGMAATQAWSRRLRSWLASPREAGWPWRRKWFRTEQSNVRLALLSGLVLAGIGSASLMTSLNLRVFEILEGVKHQPSMGRHLFWHPMFLGLGYDFHTQENIAWDDMVSVADFQAERGGFSGFDAVFDRAMMRRYLEIAFYNTPFVIHAYTHKLRALFLNPARPLTTFLSSLAVALLIGAGALSARDENSGDWTMVMAGGCIAFIAAAPALMTGLSRADACDAGLVSAAGLGLVVIKRRLRTGRQALPGDAGYTDALRRGLAVGLAIGCAGLAVVSLRAAWIEWHRESLTASLQDGSLVFDELLSEYHADAILAFNELPARRRKAIARDVIAARQQSLDEGVELLHDDAGSAVAAAIWTDRTLFVLLRLQRRVVRPDLGVVFVYEEPLAIPYAEPEGIKFMPPFTGRQQLPASRRSLYLPHLLDPGYWLFSMRASREQVRKLVLDEKKLRP